MVFFPKQINFTAVKIDDFITQAAEDIIAILTKTPEPTVPSIEAGDETNNTVLKLALFFYQTDGTNKKLAIKHKQTINISQKYWFHYQPHQCLRYYH